MVGALRSQYPLPEIQAITALLEGGYPLGYRGVCHAPCPSPPGPLCVTFLPIRCQQGLLADCVPKTCHKASFWEDAGHRREWGEAAFEPMNPDGHCWVSRGTEGGSHRHQGGFASQCSLSFPTGAAPSCFSPA